jgi:hypothetical protein
VGQLEGERPLGRPKHRLDYYIKMGFKVISSQGININDLGEDGDSRYFQHGNEPCSFRKCGEFLD